MRGRGKREIHHGGSAFFRVFEPRVTQKIPDPMFFDGKEGKGKGTTRSVCGPGEKLVVLNANLHLTVLSPMLNEAGDKHVA